MSTLETLIIIACVVLLAIIVVLVLLNIGPELTLRLKLQELQRCYDTCETAHGVGNPAHQACVKTCLAEYCLNGGK